MRGIAPGRRAVHAPIGLDLGARRRRGSRWRRRQAGGVAAARRAAPGWEPRPRLGAVVLAAGAGARLGSVAKALLPITPALSIRVLATAGAVASRHPAIVVVRPPFAAEVARGRAATVVNRPARGSQLGRAGVRGAAGSDRRRVPVASRSRGCPGDLAAVARGAVPAYRRRGHPRWCARDRRAGGGDGAPTRSVLRSLAAVESTTRRGARRGVGDLELACAPGPDRRSGAAGAGGAATAAVRGRIATMARRLASSDRVRRFSAGLDAAAAAAIIDPAVGRAAIGVGPSDLVVGPVASGRWPVTAVAGRPTTVVSRALEVHVADDESLGWAYDEATLELPMCGRVAAIPLRVFQVYARDADRWTLVAASPARRWAAGSTPRCAPTAASCPTRSSSSPTRWRRAT
jgi:hypothetical protein